MHKRLIVVDLSGFIFRAFYAIRPLHSPEGAPVNAVHGVLSMLLKLLSSYRPTHILMAKDSRDKVNFRKQIYDGYKANRQAMPEDLIPQFDLIDNMLTKMRFPSVTMPGYEADDVIGSVVKQFTDDFEEILIASGDKDLMQFVDDKVKMLDTMKDKLYGRQEVFEKMGVWPEQIVDYLSILGDSSDNIPGMKGIGAKGASKLLGEHGTLQKCIELKETYTSKRLKNAFLNFTEDAILSKKLVEIIIDLDLGVNVDDVAYSFSPSSELIEFLTTLGFRSTVKKIKEISYIDHQCTQQEEEPNSAALMLSHKVVSSQEEFKSLLNSVEQSQLIALHFEYDSRVIYKRKIISISLSFDGTNTFYLPFLHQGDLLSTDGNLAEKNLLELFTALESGDKEVVLADSNKEYLYTLINEIPFNMKVFDVTLAHYVVDSDGSHALPYLANKYFEYNLMELPKSTTPITSLSIGEASTFAGDRSAILFLLKEILATQLTKLGLEKIYNEVDLPLIPVLARMEKVGIMINHNYLKSLEDEFAAELKLIEEEIEGILQALPNVNEINMPVNLKSPKQLSDLFFNKLNFPTIKKTKTGYSTDSEVLEELVSREVGPIPALILKYRELDKLLSTYVLTLPKLVNSVSGRIHTSFSLHTAATGRLSSLEPNLQNIPVRSQNGRRIRKGFIANPGWLLLSADYSQIELRLLAHFSQDKTMVDSFNNDEDIHSQTASEVLGIPLDQVTSDERSMAKAVNFGLMYGQSSFGLAKTLRIKQGEAKDYITKYFMKFHAVKAYIDSLKELCAERGHSETLHGRKRFLPNIRSSNRNIKALAERMAINSPIQGTAADILKIAMTQIDKDIIDKKLLSRILLQVHDELILEVPEKEISIIKELVRTRMENVVSLCIPLKVDMGIGVNWFCLK